MFISKHCDEILDFVFHLTRMIYIFVKFVRAASLASSGYAPDLFSPLKVPAILATPARQIHVTSSPVCGGSVATPTRAVHSATNSTPVRAADSAPTNQRDSARSHTKTRKRFLEELETNLMPIQHGLPRSDTHLTRDSDSPDRCNYKLGVGWEDEYLSEHPLGRQMNYDEEVDRENSNPSPKKKIKTVLV